MPSPPPVVVLAAADGRNPARLRRIIDAIRAELEEDRLGAAPIAAALASSLMMIVLRTHLEGERRADGVLALLSRRQTAKALAAMLAEPARPCTLDALAEQANTSRHARAPVPASGRCAAACWRRARRWP